jgi:hypothetical protein
MGFHPDLGNVPSWIGAGSLLLAFRIFLRDHARSDRAQVDTVGIWGKIKREVIFPGNPKNDDIEIQINIGNASELPVEVHLVAFTFDTRWVIPEKDQPDPSVPIRRVVPGKADVMRFTGPIGVAPRETWEGQWLTVNLTHTAPADDGTLHMFSDGVKCNIAYALIVDNAGRRWEVRQGKGKPAKLIRWYSRSGEFYPPEWQNPTGRRVRIFKAKIIEQIRGVRKSLPSG